jgi:hypothetical protein
MRSEQDSIVVLRENASWLRHVWWACAAGLLVLVVQLLRADPVEGIKVAASVAGILLFGFSGFVLRCRVVSIDPTLREISIEDRGFSRTDTQRIALRDIDAIQIVRTHRLPEDRAWTVYVKAAAAAIPINRNPLPFPSQAHDLARRLREFCAVDIVDDTDAAIATLVRDGRIIDAVVLVREARGLSLTDAKALIDKMKQKQQETHRG